MQNITKKNKDRFIEALEENGGRCGNKYLRSYLSWDEDYYWKIQGALIGDGAILPGRGQGGSVSIAVAYNRTESVEEELEGVKKMIFRERDLYGPSQRPSSPNG